MSINKDSQKAPNLRFKGFTDDWEQRKLGDLGEVSMNKRIYKDQTTIEGEVPFVKIGTFGKKPDSFISRELFEEYKLKYPYPNIGDILISAAGSIGRTLEYNGEDVYFQDSNIVWLNHKGRLDNNFLKYFYMIVKWSGLEGSTIKRLYNKNILSTQINLPNIIEQEKIGTFLNCIENTIRLHQRKLDQLNQLKEALLQQMFPGKGETVPKLRFAGFEGDWEERKLGEISKIKTGSSDLQDADATGNYPFFVRSENIERSNRFLFEGEAILIPGEGRLGEIYHYINGKFDYHQRVYKISNFSDYNVQGLFVLYYLKKNFKRHALKYTVKATVDSLRLPTLLEFNIIVPNNEEQQHISNLLNGLEKLIQANENKINDLKTLKTVLLQNMFI
ncbi:restriction endonuclease subunit S [Aerococcus viridans]